MILCGVWLLLSYSDETNKGDLHSPYNRPLQKLFNYKDGNALINQLRAPPDVGLEIDTTAEAKFCDPVSVSNSWQNYPARPGEKLGHEEKNKIKNKLLKSVRKFNLKKLSLNSCIRGRTF
jgi:hypothetical protein